MKLFLLLLSLVPGPAEPIVHVSYGNLGVEGSIAILQVRMFKDDLAEALRRMEGLESLRMEVSPEIDALVLRYLGERFLLQVEGSVLEGKIIGSGEDELDREPVWWYQLRFEAAEVIRSARVTNTILFEIFDDQSNVLRVVKFPQEDRQAFFFGPGEETHDVTFKGGGSEVR
jgi:hypothetical protein